MSVTIIMRVSINVTTTMLQIQLQLTSAIIQRDRSVTNLLTSSATNVKRLLPKKLLSRNNECKANESERLSLSFLFDKYKD